MKHIMSVRKVVASVGMMVAFSGIGFAQCKFAVVDMLAAVVDSNEGKAQGPKFDARVKEWTAKLNILQSEISRAQKQLMANPQEFPKTPMRSCQGEFGKKPVN